MKKVPLSEVKDDLSRYIQLAAREEIVVTRHGRPAAVLIGFADEEDWFDYQLEHDPRFIARMEAAKASLESGRGITIEKVRGQLGLTSAHRRGVSSLRRGVARKGTARKKNAER